jgi:hypothetical protein
MPILRDRRQARPRRQKAVQQAAENDTAISAMLKEGYPEMRLCYNESVDGNSSIALYR